MKVENERALKVIKELEKSEFYGTLILKFQCGTVYEGKKEESIIFIERSLTTER